MMKTILATIFAFTLLTVQGQKKQDISILFVGNSPDKELTEKQMKNNAWPEKERYVEEVKTRMLSFMNLLNQYFTEVKSVDVLDYKAEMSDNYDVTIFDENPRQLVKASREIDEKTGRIIKYNPSVYLPEDYNRPTLFIGHTASTIGKSLGSKLDWYCLCLKKHAHTIKTDHQIFKGPFKVNITLKNEPTPEPLLLKEPDMAKEMPMWKVNTEDYTDGKNYRVGLVSRGYGFEDSPDAEIISGGHSDKSKEAVSIGRHGNFFLWGFAGSPDYMTEEAKKVFANAIVYTHSKRHEKLIARKYTETIATRLNVDDVIFNNSDRAYELSISSTKMFNDTVTARQKRVKAKQAKGEQLSRRDKITLMSRVLKLPTKEEFFYKINKSVEISDDLRSNPDAVIKHLNDNRPYFYSQPNEHFKFSVDVDCKSLGISNADIKILDVAISMLEKNQDVEKAKRLLWRYTIEDFETASEWRKWFNKYKKNLFFTESGGYVWLINDPNANPDVRPRADKQVVKEDAKKTSLDLEEPTHENPVSVKATIEDGDKRDEKIITIKTKIMNGYHIYAYVPIGEAYIETEQGLEIPEKVELIGEWEKTSPAPYPGKDKLLIYKGENTFKHRIKVGSNVSKGTAIKFWIKYQCCDANICFPPKKKEFTIKL